ncbi:RibD family protein [Humibacter sp.]|jgi:5-amino-6-(5-phosphoribosylamino)uracil reductase|uniref:RibD family protein n=1 Tax=Humibacter sp. TaxID=1940291 RepID=UPI002B98C114|nr:RibD family protein [Humibacter sp.]HVX08581.1 RibD family protein [Humibacter sp.]
MTVGHQHALPYVTLSSAMSIDGYLDTALPPRLVLSNAADLDRVDELRAAHDAIMVGARTVRRDNPRLLVRDETRRARRLASDRGMLPWKVTVTSSGDLDPNAAFFAVGDTEKLVYCPEALRAVLAQRLGSLATVVGLGEQVAMNDLLRDLRERGVESVVVEGGGAVHTQLLASGLADELHLVVAPFFIGDSKAPRLVADGPFPWTADHRARLLEARPIGDVVLLRYALSDRCDGGGTPKTRDGRRPTDTATGRGAA